MVERGDGFARKVVDDSAGGPKLDEGGPGGHAGDGLVEKRARRACGLQLNIYIYIV